MKNITKHLLTLFAIANLMAVYKIFHSYANIVFYVILGIGVFTIISNINIIFSPKKISTYKFIYIFIAVLWIYQLIFGWSHTFPKTWSYIISKTVMLLMTVAVIDRFPEYYLKKFYNIICYTTFGLVAYGIMSHADVNTDGRMSCGFGNPNTAGTLCAICLSYILLSDNLRVSKAFKIIMMIVLLYAILISGSRSSLGLVILTTLYKYKFSIKLVISFAVALTALFVILPHYNINFVGIDRFSDTVESGNFSSGRETEREATWLMIKSSPIEGNGIYCTQSEDAKTISELGSHNAYLDFLKWFGYPLGAILICSLFLCSLSLYNTFRKSKNNHMQAHLIIILGILGLSFFEGLIWGLNQVNNTLFFVSFAVLEHYKLKQIDINHNTKDCSISLT